MRAYWGCAVVAWALAGPLWADPLDLKQVPADAKWVVHVDFDAARDSTLARGCPKEIAEVVIRAWKEFDERNPQVKRAFRGRPEGLTLLNDRFDNDATVALLHIKADAAKLLRWPSARPIIACSPTASTNFTRGRRGPSPFRGTRGHLGWRRTREQRTRGAWSAPWSATMFSSWANRSPT